MITEEQAEEIFRMLESDLRSLMPLTFSYNKPLAEGDIRLASVILRKWLIDGLLGQLTNVAGRAATFSVLDTTAVFEEMKNKADIDYFLTGDVYFNNRPIMGIFHSTIPSNGKSRLDFSGIKRKDVKLREFLQQKRVYFQGTYFSCEQIIKYIANKRGGAHLDFKRQGDFAKMDDAAAYMTIGGPYKLESELPSDLYLRLEPKSSEIFTPFHFELVAAACSFIQIHFNGEPFLELKVRRGFRNWLRDLFRRKIPRYHIFDT